MADLATLLKEAVKRFEAMPKAEQDEMMRKQREGYARAEASWPKPKFHWENGVKVYESYEDYCNG